MSATQAWHILTSKSGPQFK